MKDLHVRCEWAGTDTQYVLYHDLEWGVPVHDDHTLFEFLTLEGAQAGLSWATILKKRENYREAFDHFDVLKVSQYEEPEIQKLLIHPGIVRNKLKIRSTVANAKAFLQIQKEFGSVDRYIWGFVDGKPKKSAFTSLKEYPTKTKEAEAMSKDLLVRGFKFVGPTICYAFMQAVGLVNDHQVQCFRYNQIS